MHKRDACDFNIPGRVKQKIRDIYENPPDLEEEICEFSTLAGREVVGFGEAALDVATDLFDPSPAKK